MIQSHTETFKSASSLDGKAAKPRTSGTIWTRSKSKQRLHDETIKERLERHPVQHEQLISNMLEDDVLGLGSFFLVQ